MTKSFDHQEARIAQSNFCNTNDLPYFAPYNGLCFRCGKNIYQPGGYSVAKAGSQLITYCPFCKYSFID